MNLKLWMYVSLGFSILNFYSGSMNLLAFMHVGGIGNLFWAALGIGIGVLCMKSYLRIKKQLRGY